MKWRIAANGAALVIAISSVAYVNGETTMAAEPQKFVANDAKSVLAPSKFENSAVGAKQTAPYVLFDSSGQMLGLTTSFNEESATVRQGAFFLKYNLRRPMHGVIPVLYGSSACTGPAFTYTIPSDGVAGFDKRYLGFGQNQWYQLDMEAPIATLKERKASDGKIYFSSLTGLGCSSQRVFSGAGVLYDEMLAVPLKEIYVEPKPATLDYPLIVEEFDSSEDYEIFGYIAVERAANGYWISVTTGGPMQRFTVVARLGGKKQLRWNSRSGIDGFKRITVKHSLSGAMVRLLVDGDVVDEVVVQP